MMSISSQLLDLILLIVGVLTTQLSEFDQTTTCSDTMSRKRDIDGVVQQKQAMCVCECT